MKQKSALHDLHGENPIILVSLACPAIASHPLRVHLVANLGFADFTFAPFPSET